MNRHSNSKFRTGLSLVLAFFLSLFLFLSTCAGVLKTTVFNENYIRTELSKSYFYDNLTEEIKQKFVSYGAASGFDEAFFDGIVDPVMVQQEIGNAIDQIYNNRVKKTDTTEFEQQLNSKFLQNVEQRGIERTPELEQAVGLLTQTCVESYTDSVTIPYVTQIGPYVRTADKLITVLLAVLVIAGAVVAVILFFLHRWKHRALRYYIYALSSAVLMSAVLPAALYFSGKIQRIGLASASFYHFAVSYLSGCLWRFGIVALCMILILVVLGILYHKLRESVK